MKIATNYRISWIKEHLILGGWARVSAVFLIFPMFFDSATGEEDKQDLRDLAKAELGTSPSVFVRIMWGQGVGGADVSRALEIKSRMDDVREIFADTRYITRTRAEFLPEGKQVETLGLLRIAGNLDEKYLSRLCREFVVDRLHDRETAEQSYLYLGYLDERDPGMIPFESVIEAFVAGRLSGSLLRDSRSVGVYFLKSLRRSVEERGLPEEGFDMLAWYEESAAKEKDPTHGIFDLLLDIRQSANEFDSKNRGEND